MSAGSNPQDVVPPRVTSIDALRGFDMVWITGGEEVIHALHQVIPQPWMDALDAQFHHVHWQGFHFYDLIFPLFVFVVGLVLPFSLTRRLEKGGSRKELYTHAVRRFVLLFFLGWVYNGLLDFNFHHLRLAGVLQRIALSYFIATLIVMNARVRAQAWITGGILLGYFLILRLVPVPGVGAYVLTPENNLCGFLDRAILPRPYCCNLFGDAEGILSSIPAVATAMLGVLAGHWLRSKHSPPRKAAGLALAGVACLAVGALWGIWFPIIKYLWTSSYVLFAGGWSLLLLALFYWIIDIRGWVRWSFFFRVIGMNAITVYLAWRFFDFGVITRIFVHGFLDYLGPVAPVFYALSVLATSWAFLWFLYRQKIFLKV